MTEIRQLIADERRELATLLKELPAEQWDAPTLCEGWRVREVVAHLTAPYRYSTPRFLLEMLRSRGRMNPMLDRMARRDAAELTAAELADCLAANANHPWKPPGGGFEGALSHDVIHGLDITVALGIDRVVPAERMRIVLGGLSEKGLKFFGVDLTGIQLRATDLDWSFGTGRVVSGPAQDLLLKVCGRAVPIPKG
ncbi:maleylpyruvate isomerase family mycothiol-dependent enzyme [Kribbella catacumbae]|uniref:maleylpyruvate isomerase family mycothiol-dependent enzyme n=1 Tax=Kribbella catacumbae TaxID=460086 RepID=UPI0003726240|nr:maleylpyruvate isomerase family mycothiol-dependent enzyme [Kribbella catacumbae]